MHCFSCSGIIYPDQKSYLIVSRVRVALFREGDLFPNIYYIHANEFCKHVADMVMYVKAWEDRDEYLDLQLESSQTSYYDLVRLGWVETDPIKYLNRDVLSYLSMFKLRLTDEGIPMVYPFIFDHSTKESVIQITRIFEMIDYYYSKR